MYKFRMAPAGARNRPPLINPGCGNLPECIRATLPTHRITRLSRTQLTTGHLSGCPRRWKLKHGAISRLARKRGSVGAAPAPVALLLPVMCDGETNTHTESQQRDAPDQVVEFESSGGDACLGAIYGCSTLSRRCHSCLHSGLGSIPTRRSLPWRWSSCRRCRPWRTRP